MTNQVIGFARLPLQVAVWSDMIAVFDSGWQPHFNTVVYEGNWEVLPLRSPGGSSSNIVADLNGQHEYADTVYMQHMQPVKALIDRLQCPVMAIRLLNLKAGATIKRHRDHDLAFEQGEARLHFPVVTNDKVAFYVQDRLVPMRQGECWYINANLPHSVANNGDTDRIHLVADCRVNDWLINIFEQAEKVLFTQATDKAATQQIIRSLRLQNTVTSNETANTLETSLGRSDNCGSYTPHL